MQDGAKEEADKEDTMTEEIDDIKFLALDAFCTSGLNAAVLTLMGELNNPRYNMTGSQRSQLLNSASQWLKNNKGQAKAMDWKCFKLFLDTEFEALGFYTPGIVEMKPIQAPSHLR